MNALSGRAGRHEARLLQWTNAGTAPASGQTQRKCGDGTAHIAPTHGASAHGAARVYVHPMAGTRGSIPVALSLLRLGGTGLLGLPLRLGAGAGLLGLSDFLDGENLVGRGVDAR